MKSKWVVIPRRSVEWSWNRTTTAFSRSRVFSRYFTRSTCMEIGQACGQRKRNINTVCGFLLPIAWELVRIHRYILFNQKKQSQLTFHLPLATTPIILLFVFHLVSIRMKMPNGRNAHLQTNSFSFHFSLHPEEEGRIQRIQRRNQDDRHGEANNTETATRIGFV